MVVSVAANIGSSCSQYLQREVQCDHTSFRYTWLHDYNLKIQCTISITHKVEDLHASYLPPDLILFQQQSLDVTQTQLEPLQVY